MLHALQNLRSQSISGSRSFPWMGDSMKEAYFNGAKLKSVTIDLFEFLPALKGFT